MKESKKGRAVLPTKYFSVSHYRCLASEKGMKN
jgi:hypothetical protein